jgi:phosphate-selective porin OprO/OprP
MRFFSSGTGYGIYEYKLQVEFEPENDGAEAVSMKDVYIGVNEVPFLGTILMGHFKAPFSLEELISSRYITFMERGLLNIFAPSRDVGIAAYNYSPDQNWTWGGGVFYEDISDTLKERVADNQGVALVGRATWTPYYDEPSDGRYMVHVGLGGQWRDDRDDVVRFRARPEVHEGPRWIDTGDIAADTWTAVNPELAVVWGPFSVQSELVAASVDAPGTPNFYGAYVYGSWFLTGEHRPYTRTRGTYGRVKPYTNFWMVRGAGIGTGAIELAARWSYLDLSGTTDFECGEQNDFTLGVNWYWNPYMRWMFNYIHAENVYDNNGLQPETDIIAVRGQVDF